jgi:hypothetical protein
MIYYMPITRSWWLFWYDHCWSISISITSLNNSLLSLLVRCCRWSFPLRRFVQHRCNRSCWSCEKILDTTTTFTYIDRSSTSHTANNTMGADKLNDFYLLLIAQRDAEVDERYEKMVRNETNLQQNYTNSIAARNVISTCVGRHNWNISQYALPFTRGLFMRLHEYGPR